MDQTAVNRTPVPDTGEGDRIIRWSWGATATLTLALAAGVVSPTKLGLVSAAISVLFFGSGIVAFLWAYAVAVSRSRTDDVSVAGLYLMGEGAPPRVRRQMLASLGVQCAVAAAAAIAKPFTAVVFGLLAPILGLGLIGVWSARHGVFRPRQLPPRRGASRPMSPREPTLATDSARISDDVDGGADA